MKYDFEAQVNALSLWERMKLTIFSSDRIGNYSNLLSRIDQNSFLDSLDFISLNKEQRSIVECYTRDFQESKEFFRSFIEAHEWRPVRQSVFDNYEQRCRLQLQNAAVILAYLEGKSSSQASSPFR